MTRDGDIDLRFPEPDQYLHRNSSDLFLAIENLPKWDEQTLEAADMLLVIWTSRACDESGEHVAEIISLLKTLHFVLNGFENRKTLPEMYAQRWGALRDVLISRHRAVMHKQPFYWPLLMFPLGTALRRMWREYKENL